MVGIISLFTLVTFCKLFIKQHCDYKIMVTKSSFCIFNSRNLHFRRQTGGAASTHHIACATAN